MKLPGELIKETASDLFMGEEVFVVPWAMFVDGNGDLQIAREYSFHRRKEGTADMKITRVAGGFSVDLSQCREKKLSPSSASGYHGGITGIPVVELVGY